MNTTLCLCLCVRRVLKEGGNGIRGNTFWQGWESHLTLGLSGTRGESGVEEGETRGLILVHLWKVIPRALRIWSFDFCSACFS